MLRWALVFLIVALVAGLFGFGDSKEWPCGWPRSSSWSFSFCLSCHFLWGAGGHRESSADVSTAPCAPPLGQFHPQRLPVGPIGISE